MSVVSVPLLVMFLVNMPQVDDKRGRYALVSAVLDSIARLSRQDPANRQLLTDSTIQPELYSQFWMHFTRLAQQSVEDGNCSHKVLQAMQSLCEHDSD